MIEQLITEMQEAIASKQGWAYSNKDGEFASLCDAVTNKRFASSEQDAIDKSKMWHYDIALEDVDDYFTPSSMYIFDLAQDVEIQQQKLITLNN